MKTLSLISAFIFLSSFANAQFIIAGQHGLNDYYYQFSPDSIYILKQVSNNETELTRIVKE